MGLFDDERLTRLTISVTQAQRRRLGELARRAGRGVTMGRVAAALDKGLDAVTAGPIPAPATFRPGVPCLTGAVASAPVACTRPTPPVALTRRR